jgi:hypothetical protein
MPSTPRFTVTQNEEYVLIEIAVPYVRVSEAEFVVEGSAFSFYCQPYLLKLSLPGPCVDDERAKATYDVEKDHGTVTCHLPKRHRGAHFENLDLISVLMRQSGGAQGAPLPGQSASGAPPSIEVLASEQHCADDVAAEGSITHEALDAFIHGEGSVSAAEVGEEGGAASVAGEGECGSTSGGVSDIASLTASLAQAQQQGEPSIAKLLPAAIAYGFLDRFSGFLAKFRTDIPDIVALPEPDTTPAAKRRALRVAAESEAFAPERYAADSQLGPGDDYVFDMATDACFRPHWLAEGDRACATAAAAGLLESMGALTVSEGSGASSMGTVDAQLAPAPPAHAPAAQVQEERERRALGGFTADEQEQLRQLPRREHLVSEGGLVADMLLRGLAGVLVGYAYDHRTSQGCGTCESAWAICTISPLLSWLDTPRNWDAVAKTSCRRLLAFPYLRHWGLAMTALEDAAAVMERGVRCTLRCLLQIRELLKTSEVHYLLNSLYVEDFCLWVQTLGPDVLPQAATALRAAVGRLRKGDIGWKLVALEASARGGVEEEAGAAGAARESESSDGSDGSDSSDGSDGSDGSDRSDSDSDGSDGGTDEDEIVRTTTTSMPGDLPSSDSALGDDRDLMQALLRQTQGSAAADGSMSGTRKPLIEVISSSDDTEAASQASS